jgi:hypothetical protein
MTTILQTVGKGIQTRIPGTYIQSSFPPEAGGGTVPLGNVVILGESMDGVPAQTTDADITDANKFNFIGSSDQSFSTLKGMNGAYACSFFLDPSPDANLNKPSGVNFVRVNNATRATGNVKNGGATNIIDLKSTSWGYSGNQVSRKIIAGTTSGHRVTITQSGKQIADQDNVGYARFSIRYVGAGSAASMAITSSTLTTTVTGAVGDSLSLSLSNYPTMIELVSFIQQNAAYSCTLLSYTGAPTATMDVITGQDIKTASYTVNSNTLALIDWFNNNTGGVMTANITAGATYLPVDNDTAYVFLSGGTVTGATLTDWTNVLTWLKTQQGRVINCIIPATGDISIITAVKSYAEEMSSVINKHLQAGVFGAATSDNRATKLANARGLNSARGEYWITPILCRDYLYGNVARTFDPFYAGVMAAGIRYANDVTIAANDRPLQIQGVAETYNKDQKEEQILAGCSYVHPDGTQFVVGENVTTYQTTNEILSRPSMLRTCDAIDLDSIKQIQTRIRAMDRAATAGMIKDLENWIQNTLLVGYRDNQGWLTVDPNNNAPAFSNVSFSVTGTKFSMTYRGIVPSPILFVAVANEFVIVGSTLNQTA